MVWFVDLNKDLALQMFKPLFWNTFCAKTVSVVVLAFCFWLSNCNSSQHRLKSTTHFKLNGLRRVSAKRLESAAPEGEQGVMKPEYQNLSNSDNF